MNLKERIHIQIPRNVQKIILYAAGPAILLLVYVLVFQSLQAQSQNLLNDRSRLRLEETQVRAMQENRQANLDAMDEMNREMNAMLAEFPADVMEEDSLMYVIGLEDALGSVDFSSVSFTPKNLLYSAENSDYRLYSFSVEYRFKTGYRDMKTALADILADSDTKNIESISLSLDKERGLIEGTMTLNHFSVEGDGQIYEETDIPPMSIGTDNLFGIAD